MYKIGDTLLAHSLRLYVIYFLGTCVHAMLLFYSPIIFMLATYLHYFLWAAIATFVIGFIMVLVGGK
jgi:hypothetical protein